MKINVWNDFYKRNFKKEEKNLKIEVFLNFYQIDHETITYLLKPILIY